MSVARPFSPSGKMPKVIYYYPYRQLYFFEKKIKKKLEGKDMHRIFRAN